MIKFPFVVLAIALSGSAFASDYTCTPSQNNSTFIDDVHLGILSATQIEVNRVKLDLDKTYKPRRKSDFKRYEGNTVQASGWEDSGVVEIYLNRETKRLVYRVRGSTYFSESFNCK